MTGATYFTRRAGRIGVGSTALVVVVAALYLVAYATTGAVATVAVGVAVFASVLALVGLVVSFVGILVRHRGESWLRTFLLLAAAAVALGILGRAAEADGVSNAGGVVLALGLLSAREMPRPACLALVAGALLGLLLPGDLWFVSAVPDAFGFTMLCWAMWREPIPADSPAWDEGYRIPARI